MSEELFNPFSGLDPDDMAIPEIKLVQATGGDEAKAGGAHPGDFYCSVTGQAYAGDLGIEIVVFRVRKSRTYWGREELTDEPPVCASNDGKVNLNGEPCEQCPYGVKTDAAWLVKASERRLKCNVKYTILAVDLASLMPVMIRAGGISATPLRELNTQLAANPVLKGEWHRAKIQLTSHLKKTQSGNAYAMKFKFTELLKDPDLVETVKTIGHQMLNYTVLAEGIEAPAEEESKPKMLTAPEFKGQTGPLTSGQNMSATVVKTPVKAESKQGPLPAEHQPGAAPVVDF